MMAIVDWDSNASQWPAVLKAVRSGKAAPDLAASPLWQVYGPLSHSGGPSMPFVIGQIGQSLDGRIATPTGHSHYINGAAAIVHLHRLRALVDAVVVGVSTAALDDPKLSVRHVEGPAPARVVIDPSGRLPNTAYCLKNPDARRVVIQSVDVARPDGVEVVKLPAGANGLRAVDILVELKKLGFNRVLIEGGAFTLSRFVAGGCIHRLHVMMAPLIIGSGPTGLSLPPIKRLDEAKRPPTHVYEMPGGEVLFDCEMNT